MSIAFPGRQYLLLLNDARQGAARQQRAAVRTQMALPARKRAPDMKVRVETPPWPLLYGYRPVRQEPEQGRGSGLLRYLNPWEFTEFYEALLLQPPCTRRNREITQWCGDGEKFYEEHRGEHEHAEDPVFLVAGVHYQLRPLGELATQIASG